MKLLPLLLVLPLSIAGCSHEDPVQVSGPCGLQAYPASGGTTARLTYLPLTSPDNVLKNLERAWERRDTEAYASLLAEDFRLFYDPPTRGDKPALPEWWTRFTDVTETAMFFESPVVKAVRLDMTYSVSGDVNELGRETWKLIDIEDWKLEVTRQPPGSSEETTYLYDGSGPLRVYFRKGRNPSDTIATSCTAQNWYITEWRGKSFLPPKGEQP